MDDTSRVTISSKSEDTILTIRCNDSIYQFHSLWLQDHCPCTQCRHVVTRQRNSSQLLLVHGVPTLSGIKLVDSDKVHIQIGDHISVFDLTWLTQNAYWKVSNGDTNNKSSGNGRILWTSNTFGGSNEFSLDVDRRHLPHVPLTSYLEKDEVLLEALESLLTYGFVIVTGVEATDAATEQVLTRISFLRESLYGKGMWRTELRSQDNATEFVDSSYSRTALPLHNDGCYFESPPGLQAFHAIELEPNTENEKTSGLSLLADGFAIAKEVKAQYPDEYKLLSEIRVPYAHVDPVNILVASHPIITLDPMTKEPLYVAFNDCDRATISPSLCNISHDFIPSFYRMLDVWKTYLLDDRFHLKLSLQPGSVLIFNNRRVLHSRTRIHENVTTRILSGAYINTEDWMSKLHSLSRKYRNDSMAKNVL
jgi:trimethyllysine dioxygenase